ncbi:MAG: ribosome-binding factor A [Deltaproteobacteria bacterium RIFCSPHIGHO2_12_FULL_43_9]|nr:MAG: ribosome-binding factor A [Deltaproteobacteria bacterium RIFCSPHIGHO2_12_FULL_43_9]
MLIAQGLQDPRISPLSVTDVEVSADLRIARIFVAIFDKGNIDTTLDGLKSATPHLRRQIAAELNLRFTPDLEFFYDESLERGARIESLISSLRKNK